MLVLFLCVNFRCAHGNINIITEALMLVRFPVPPPQEITSCFRHDFANILLVFFRPSSRQVNIIKRKRRGRDWLLIIVNASNPALAYWFQQHFGLPFG